MEQWLLNETTSIRNRLAVMIVKAEPKIGKEWNFFHRLVSAHKTLMGCEIDKATTMTDDKQPELPGMPEKTVNLCKYCSVFESCVFEIKKAQGVADCDSYQLREQTEEATTEPTEGEGEGVSDHQFTPIQDMPHSELSDDEKARLQVIKDETGPVSLATFEVSNISDSDGGYTVSMCGVEQNHITLVGATVLLFQKLGYAAATPEALKDAIYSFPDSDKRALILGILDPKPPEEKKRGRRKKSEPENNEEPGTDE